MKILLFATGLVVAALAERPCRCDCCSAVTRMPDEVIHGQHLKCSFRKDSNQCEDMCQTDDSDHVLRAGMGHGVQTLDTARFCFFECMPEGTEVDATCTTLTEEQRGQLETADGDAHDPATLVKSYATLLQAKSPQPVDDPETAANWAKVTFNKARETASGARKTERGLLRKLYGEMTKANTPREQSEVAHLNEDFPESLRIAQEAAHEAGEAGRAAAAMLPQIRKKAYEGAAAEGQVEMKQVMEAEKKEYTDHEKWLAKLGKDAGAAAIAASSKAAEPYFHDMLNAQKTMQDYEASGNKYAAKARTLYAKSKELEKAANDLQAQGKEGPALRTINAAKVVFKEAQDAGKQADTELATADELRKSLPKFSNAARMAAARAAYEATPELQPPPPPTGAQMR